MELRRTAGSADNLRLLRDPASGVHAAFVQGGVAEGTDDGTLVSLGRVAHEPLWLFYRAERLQRQRVGQPPVRLADLAGWRIDVAQAEAYARRFSFLQPLVLPRGVVDLAADRPPADVHLVSASASLVVRAELHPALMQLLLQAAQQAHGEGGWFHRRGEFPNPGADLFPLADEAARHYRSGPPWLQRYLPFWLANFVDRMWIVLLPLLVQCSVLFRT
ncbi:MAG: hypothetical protein Fur0014_22340 [Rubrivivax sp.]